MFGYNPASQLFYFSFAKNVFQSPQQRLSRFFNRVAMEQYSSIQEFKPIMPQLDGFDFDPYPALNVNPGGQATKPSNDRLPFQESPFQQFDVKQVGIKFRAHTLNVAIDRTTAWTLSVDYRNMLANMYAASLARFRDRVLLFNADNTRVINNTWSKTAIGSTTEPFPDGNRYIVGTGKAGGAPDLSFLDLTTLLDMRTAFDNDELMDMGQMPVCVGHIYQIRNLLNEQKIQNADYNTIRALVQGEVNSFMGFEFIKCKAGQTSAVNTIYGKTGANAARDDVKAAVTGGYAAIAEADKVIFAYPGMAFGAGYIPQAGYMRIVEDQFRGFAWKFMLQEVIAYRRKQNEYIRVAYAKKHTKTGVDIRRAPVKLAAYYDNYSNSGANWNYGADGKTAA